MEAGEGHVLAERRHLPALQRVHPRVDGEPQRSLLLLLHGFWQETFNGEELMFDPVAGQRRRQLCFKAKDQRRQNIGLLASTESSLTRGYVARDLPKDYSLHKGYFRYSLLVFLVLPREELSILKVVEHDHEKAHVIIGLEHEEENRTQSFPTEVVTTESILNTEVWHFICNH